MNFNWLNGVISLEKEVFQKILIRQYNRRFLHACNILPYLTANDEASCVKRIIWLETKYFVQETGA
jgi:hypothetical protein